MQGFIQQPDYDYTTTVYFMKETIWFYLHILSVTHGDYNIYDCER